MTKNIKTQEEIMLNCLRQQKSRDDLDSYSLADYIDIKDDFIGAFAVTGHGIEDYINKYESNLDDYNAIIVKALADRFAEGFAECLYTKVRTEFWDIRLMKSLAMTI